jgi:hypothetical protein
VANCGIDEKSIPASSSVSLLAAFSRSSSFAIRDDRSNAPSSFGGWGGVTDLEEKSVDRVSGAGAPTPRGVSGGGLPPLGEGRAFFLRGRRGAFTSASKLGGKGGLAIHENERQRTTLNTIEITGLVLKNVLTKRFFGVFFAAFTYEKRRGRESNPRIAVLQTATLPLGYPAELWEK